MANSLDYPFRREAISEYIRIRVTIAAELKKYTSGKILRLELEYWVIFGYSSPS